MSDGIDNITVASFIDAPVDADLVTLHGYWSSKRRGRGMPSRADIDPAEIKPLLPHIVMYDCDAEAGYRIRLVGEAVISFIGRNFTGQPAASGMEPKPAEMMRMILRTVAETGSPRYRAGKAYWWREKAYRDYEACFLPLSPDDRTVNIILAGLKFAV